MSEEFSSKPVGVRLRLFREKWGWSLPATARRLRELSAYTTGKEATVSADTVGRWERGVSFPRRKSQILLCQLLGVAPEDLGFSVVVPPVPARPHEGATLAQLLSWWLDTTTDRRMWLGPVLPRRFWPSIYSVEEDPLDHAVWSIGWYRRSGESSTRDSYARTLTQLHTLAQLVREAGTPSKPLVHAVASIAQLITEFAFDQRELTVATWYYSLTMVAVHEAGDQALETYAFVSCAHTHLEMGKAAPKAVLMVLPYALPEDMEVLPAALRAYILTVEAELRIRERDDAGADRCLKEATAAMSLADHEEPPAWLVFGHAEFAARYGRCLLVRGQVEEAQRWLEKALDSLDVLNSRRRAAILIDLAAAHLGQGHSADGCKYARQGLQFATEAGSDHVMERFNQLYTLLYRLITEPEVMEFLKESLQIIGDYYKIHRHPEYRHYPIAPAQWT